MIEVRINGQPETLPEAMTVAALVAARKIDGLFAIARNQEFVPRSQYEQTTIKAGDELEIVAPMQGG